jgi:putative ABC transport system permease protein
MRWESVWWRRTGTARAPPCSGATGLAWLWLRALADALWNGFGERLRPAVSWRRTGNWGRDLELARRRLLPSRVFIAATLGTLTVGLGAFAVVYTAVDKILIERMPYSEPDDLYFVWRDQSASAGLNRDWLAGPDVADSQNAHGVIEGAVGAQLSVPTLSVRSDGEPLQILMMLTSPNLFELLGVAPMLGRGWGPNFRFVRHSTLGPPQEPDVYLPFGFHLADQDPQNPNTATFAALVRVRAGTSSERAAAAVDAVARVVNERNHQALKGLLIDCDYYDAEALLPLLSVVGVVLAAIGYGARDWAEAGPYPPGGRPVIVNEPRDRR